MTMTLAEVLALASLEVAILALVVTFLWRLNAKIGANVAELHRRINDTRETYVRRDDLMGHITRIEDGQKAIIAAVNQLHQRIDGLADRRAGQGDD